MSVRSMLFSVAMLLAASALVIMLGVQRLRQANRQLSAAQSGLLQTQFDARTIIDLRGRAQTVETRQRPAQDVIALVNAVLAEVGIPGTHLQSLTPESETAAPSVTGPVSTRLLQQSLRLALQGLTPQQIGSFLTQWQASQHVWHATRLELVHRRGNDQVSAATGGGNEYDVIILLTAWYVSEATIPPLPNAPPNATSNPPPNEQERP